MIQLCKNKHFIYKPNSNLLSFISIPMIFFAPAALQPIITANPTAPNPNTAHVELASTFAVFRAAPNPVETPQPKRQILSKAAAAST